MNTNSLTTVLAEIFRRDKNLLEWLDSYSKLLNGDNDTIDVTYTDTDGNEQTYTIPSIGHLLKRISNTEANIAELSNIDNLSNATIRLPDGSIRSIVVAEQFIEPPAYSVPVLTNFYSKRNPVKETLIDPFLHIQMPISRDTYPTYDKAQMNKVLMTLNTDDKKSLFEGSIKNKQLPYDEFKTLVNSNEIEIEENLIETPITSSRFTTKGTFDILQISTKGEAIVAADDGDFQPVYKLNTLFYKNVDTNTDIYLAPGDKINVGEQTVYEINFVDRATNYVGVELVKGYEPITTGVAKMLFLGGIDTPYVEGPISQNQYVIFFVKPINSDLSILSNDWGVGYAFWTNDLLESEETSSFWESLDAITNENLIPTTSLVVPNQPILSDTNFSIVTVNDHRSNAGTLTALRTKFSQKREVESNVKSTQDEIVNLEKEISTTPADDNASKNKLTIQLATSKEKLNNYSRELNSSVNDLNASAIEVGDFTPKRQIQGFITAGTATVTDDGSTQTVIGYDTEYRYLNKDEVKSENNSIDLTEGNITKKAIIPKWLKMPNPKIREKDADGNWLEENTGDVEAFNINQVTISITSNEKVEIRTRAISEVGYPFNINYSEWSESLIIEFPEELVEDVDSIIEQSKSDIVQNRIFERLEEMGITIHNLDSTNIGEQYYAHFLRNLGTDDLSPENKPINAQTVIDSLKSRIVQLEGVISSNTGKLRVRVLAEDETVVGEVTNNGTIKIFDEFYKNIIENNTVKKGSIVDRVFYIEITNTGEGNLEVFPYVTGVSDDKLIPNYTGFAFNLDEYNQFRQPYLAPLSRLNVVEDVDFVADKQNATPFVEIPTFQSSQVKGQMLYSRGKDITLNNDLWIDDPTGAVLPIFSPTGPEAFLWDGTQTPVGGPVGGNGGLTDFCVHTDHPSLADTSDYMQNFNDYYGVGPVQTLPLNTATPARAYYPEFVMNKAAADPLVTSQLSYFEYTTNGSGSANLSNFPRKVKFSANDQYLVGKNTCGLYFSLGTNDTTLFTESEFANTGVIVKSDDRLLIPLTISARLTDYYGVSNTGVGRVGGVAGLTNITYSKKIGIDILVKESVLELQKLLSFDIQYSIQYERSSVS